MMAATIGSFIGSYVPGLWGDTSFLSMSGVIFTAIGGFAGIWLAYKLLQN